ncbi:lysophospholipid acyltransferase family protein [Chloroflexota bacterium]
MSDEHGSQKAVPHTIEEKEEVKATLWRGFDLRRRLSGLWDSLSFSILKALYMAPWFIMVSVFRIIYGFRVEGKENIPEEGPLILLIHEPSLIGVVVAGWITIVARLKVLGKRQDRSMAYMQDYLFLLPYFRKLLTTRRFGRYGGLLSHSAGRTALSLLDGYRVIGEGGLVTMNPAGEGPWDGRPVSLGHSLAWLALHTAAPIVPAVCSIGAYDIWPRWRIYPSLRGSLVLRIGAPFRLADTPQEEVGQADLEAASIKAATLIEAMSYGEGGVEGWIGPDLRNGTPLERLPSISRPVSDNSLRGELEAQEATKSFAPQVSPLRRGIAQLLWQCPVCCTNDALAWERRLLHQSTLACRACETRWRLRRIAGRDFRLEVVHGEPEILGLEMALSHWYDEMKRGFQPVPLPVSDLELLPGEEAYLVARDVSLHPYKPNPLFEGWSGRNPPTSQTPIRPSMASWGSLGAGRLVLTSERMVWQGEQGELDFEWASVRAVLIWLVNTLGLRYGTALYRFGLGPESGLKWLTHAGTLAQEAADLGTHTIGVSPY